jgi:Na+/H+-dicarboxylate symporter
MRKLPLHYQIFIALVLGTVVGLLVNPGEVQLADEVVPLTQTARPAAALGKAAGAVAADDIAVQVADPRGLEDALSTFIDPAALSARFPQLGKQYAANEPPVEVQHTAQVHVTHRRVNIVEDGETITLQYNRRHDGRPVSSTIKAANASQLAERSAAWADIYAQHGGGWRRSIAVWAKFVGDIFLRLLKMVTIPLIVTSLVTGVAGLGDTSKLGSMFGKTMLYYVCTSMLAITTGICMVNLIQPGVGADLPGGAQGAVAGQDQTLGGIFVGLINQMIPTNPVSSLAGAEFLSIITFSILLGIFIIRTGGQSGETLRNFFQAAFDVMMSMTMFVIGLAPIGVLAFMIFATATQGADIFKTLAWYMLAVFLALAFHAAVTLPLILKFVARRSPWQYAQALSPALMTAFSTASSNGTLPLTMTSVEERAGVPNRVTSFVLPLGATINMDGTALYEAVAVLFIAQATPGFAMTLEAQILVAITALLASVGAAGIPHAGLVMMAIVLQAVGLPIEAQGVIIAVDRVLDMCRTMVNVWSDAVGCAVVDRLTTADGAAIS